MEGFSFVDDNGICCVIINFFMLLCLVSLSNLKYLIIVFIKSEHKRVHARRRFGPSSFVGRVPPLCISLAHFFKTRIRNYCNLNMLVVLLILLLLIRNTPRQLE
ncbi:hypothetical protein L1887_13853 [Cichorium endivia]|nr:hypothetical protein L1887_13853 [Cichorium endivia]